ncbi:MAG: hypothetical protein JNG90_02460 [Planctomycetaceae bacterium]|nr:hypothetical protein [Planctomycetaceae bacterium]
MSTPTRREQLETLLADDPGDAFLRYGLALELEKSGEHAASLDLLAGLTRDEPPYVPAYFMAAQQLAGLERTNEARTFLRNGIVAARQQGNSHAAGEMAEFLAQLGGRGE